MIEKQQIWSIQGIKRSLFVDEKKTEKINNVQDLRKMNMRYTHTLSSN